VQEKTSWDENASRTTGEGGKARRIIFYVLLILFALLHFTSPLPFALLGWFLEEGTISHRVHLIVFGWVFVLSLMGLLAQVRRPQTKTAQMYQVLISIALFNAITMIVDRYVDPFVIMILILPFALVALHPNRSSLLSPSIHVSKTLMSLAVVAAVPLVTDAVVQLQIGVEASRIAAPIFQELDNESNLSDAEFERRFNAAARRVTDSPEQAEEAAHAGHWSAMGAFNLIIVGLALVASFRPPGWRLPAWSAGLSSVLFGAASIANQGDASALNGYWSVLAIAWGIGFIVTAETTRRARAADPVTPAATA
jgi:hypothetical protein